MASKSAHIDTFAKENLPDLSLWPELILDHPTVIYPEQLNACQELLEKTIEKVGESKLALIAADGNFTYSQLLKLVNQIKEDLKVIDRDGITHPLIDNVYETLELIEDEIYEDDAQADALSFEDDDY